jgi:decaprenylphospho-beta-D-ribofuranose 2-oxidase
MEHGGRIYLAKDCHVARRAFDAMYPRVADFHKIRAEIDPGGVLASDLSRRLGL